MKDAVWDFGNTHFYFLLWAYYFSEKEQELAVAEKYNVYKNVTGLVSTAILNAKTLWSILHTLACIYQEGLKSSQNLVISR